MRVVIPGGSGLLGKALATHLAKDGHEVILLSRSPERVEDLPAGVAVAAWDARTGEGWSNLADGADAIVNLTGESLAVGRWTSERKRRIRESRLQSGYAVVQAVGASRRKPHVVLQASAVGYYGPRRDEVVTEDSPPGSDFLARLCVEWESSTASIEAMGVRRVILRTGIPLTRKGGVLPRMVLPFRLFVGGPLGNGRQWFPWIHIDDYVRCVRALIDDSQAQGPFNLSAPNPVTNQEFSRALGRVLRRPSLIPVPALALRVLFGEMATVLLSGQRQVPQRLLDMGFQFRFPDLQPALEDLLR